MPNQKQIPKHIAIVMDGNGRWAKLRGKSRWFGHRAGSIALENVIKATIKINIPTLTVFAFGIENWKRPKKEVAYLMKLFLIILQKYLNFLQENNIKLKVIGNRNLLSEKHRSLIDVIERETVFNTRLTLNVAISYSGRWDILNAVKSILIDAENQKLDITELCEKNFANYLELASQPDVDLFIRTSGEQRISNFVLWQLAYTELYFTDQFWPDFDEKSLHKAIEAYNNRTRRFGLTDAQVIGDDKIIS